MAVPLAQLLHDLALLALALAYGADGDLAAVELAVIEERLGRWVPGQDPARVRNALREATLSYGEGLPDAQLGALVGRLRDALGTGERGRVLADLRALAAADSVVRPAEEALVRRVAAAWA